MADSYLEHEAATAFADITELDDLDQGQIWLSAPQTQTIGACKAKVKISYKICVGTTGDVLAGDKLLFYFGRGDDATSNEIRSGGVGTTEDVITAAASIDQIEDGFDLVHSHRIDAVDQDVQGIFEVDDPGPDWQLAIQLDSDQTSVPALDTTGHILRKAYVNDGDGS